MRTKHFLFTLAIGALATACSQDEFEGQADQAIDAKLSIRPEIGNVFTLAEDPLTRLTTPDGDKVRPVFAENDKLGAAIIDIPAYSAPYASTAKAIEQYNIIEGYGCNNAFSTTDGGSTWKSEQPMVEGNYLFYAPYQPGLAFRSPLKVLVPAKQDGSEEKKALKDFYESGEVVRVGYKFLASGNETKTPSVTMYDVFSYPKFTLKNNFDGYLFESKNGTVASGQEVAAKYNGEIIVDSIQFCAANASVKVGGYLKHTSGTEKTTTAVNAANNFTDGTPAESVIQALHEKKNGFSDDGEWTILNKKLTTETASLLNSTGAVVNGTAHSGVVGGNVITTVIFGENGKKVANKGTLSFHAVFPATQFNFGANALTAKVYITIGEKHYVIANATFATPVEGKEDKLDATPAKKDGVVFTANGNKGLNTLTFANGQKLPSEAIYIDAAEGKLKPKENVNDLLEISLVGGVPATGDLTKQIAVQYEKGAAAPVTEVKTTADLITLISNAATGTNWVEGATDSDNEKGFKVATDNTLEINSALIDAMFNNNRYGNLTLTTVAPISNDVKVKSVANGNEVTFESANGNKKMIKLDGAVVTDAVAENKYLILPASFTVTNLKDGNVVIANASTSLAITKAQIVKSLHVTEGGSLTITGDYALTAKQIRVDGTMSVEGDVAAEILNEGTMTISKNVVGKIVNNNTINVSENSAFTVSGGRGDVVMNHDATTKAIVVGAAATQRVIYVADGAVNAGVITAAAGVPSVNTLKANGAVTLGTADIAKLKGIKTVILNDAGIATKDAGTYNLSGITIDATLATSEVTWAGTVSTTVNNATIILNTQDMKLETISVNGSSEYKGTGRILADGVSAKWNGGKAEK